MDYFVVRIYRRRKNDSRVLVGVVEEMQEQGKGAFTSYDELWEILNGRKQLMTRPNLKQKKRRPQ